MPTAHRKRMVEQGYAPPHHSDAKVEKKPAAKTTAKKTTAKK